MILELQPLDTLFFRDGKPFNKGEETWADAIFPPFPATIYGALRTAYFNEHIEIFEKLKREEKLNTVNDPTTELKINNIFIKADSDYLFKCPQNILENKKETKILKPIKHRSISSENKLELLLNETDGLFSYKESWLGKVYLKKYLENFNTNYTLKDKTNLFELEPKVGIALNYQSRTSDESNLYRVDMLRLKEDISIVVDFEGLAISGKSIKLGGEGKFVSVQNLAKSIEIPFPKIDNNFLLYISTPTIFKKGWLPDWIDKDSLKGKIPNTDLTVKLLTASIGKPDLIGGFDMAKRKPKPMYKAVPAGSVYFFEILEGNSSELEKIHQKSISDIYPEQGFGICYVGKF